MNQSLKSSQPKSKPPSLEIFYTQISNNNLSIIVNILNQTYSDIINTVISRELELSIDAYDQQRNQYNADILLRSLLTTKKEQLALWIITQDLFIKNMNFIFGLAYYFQGAILSFFRLSTKELREKESIHEIGHVLGLSHCRNTCVMQYSNSLQEAQQKPLLLCESCKRILNIKKSNRFFF